MAKILQIIDVDADGHKVRLDDGRVVHMTHGGDHPQIGDTFTEDEADSTVTEDIAQNLRDELAFATEIHRQDSERIEKLKAERVQQNERMNADRDKESLAYSQRITELESQLAAQQAEVKRLSAVIKEMETSPFVNRTDPA